MSEPKVFVAGDYVLDRHIYEGRRHHFGDRRGRGVQEVAELGGAALVHYLLANGRGVTSRMSVRTGEAGENSRMPDLPPGTRVPPELCAYAVWRPFDRGVKPAPEKAVWRTEDAMGFGCLPESDSAFEWPGARDVPKKPDVIVLSDGGMDFRQKPKRWPADILLKQSRWIVLKTAQPFGEGDLWRHLTRPGFQDKLVVIVSASDLRKGPAWISEGLSWDATVESTLAALAPGGAHQQLCCCRHLVIAFGTEGALWLETGKSFADSKAHLVYTADCVEGEQRDPVIRGRALGTLSCLTASVAWRLAEKQEAGDSPDLETALEGGLSAMFDVLDQGHGRATAPGEGFPAKRLSKVIAEATCRYSRTSFSAVAPASKPPCAVKMPAAADSACWSLMHEALRQEGALCPEPAWDLSERVACRGPIALGSLPHLAVGNLRSADRREIESLRILRRLMLDYRSRKATDCKKPLSIGVFGPPGAGKSFAVKEIARAVMDEKERKDGWLEFNLSQFKEGAEDLIGAFHQIRDRVLRAITPIAFFDEFDSRAYQWLQYLLAPMQDGAFQDGQITHPIGKCILIFAGATSSTFATFGPPRQNDDAWNKFRMAKGPDFKSRLDGFLDILGPNRRQIVTAGTDGLTYEEDSADPCDVFYPVRRAFVIRAEFGCQPDERLKMDSGLLRALLRAEKYEHGSRSLAKLIEPLKAGRPGFVYRSLLPPNRQLGLHVNAESFLCDCDSACPPEPVAARPSRDVVAEAIHETYRQLGRDQGWLESCNDVDYGDLHDFYTRSNLAAAERMVATMALVGLRLEKGKASTAETTDIQRRIEHNLELLAEAEHAGWMAWHLDQGWEYGPEKSSTKLTEAPAKRAHPCLLRYLDLSDKERNKDRNTIRHYPEFAEKAGMKIVLPSAVKVPGRAGKPGVKTKRKQGVTK